MGGGLVLKIRSMIIENGPRACLAANVLLIEWHVLFLISESNL